MTFVYYKIGMSKRTIVLFVLGILLIIAAIISQVIEKAAIVKQLDDLLNGTSNQDPGEKDTSNNGSGKDQDPGEGSETT